MNRIVVVEESKFIGELMDNYRQILRRKSFHIFKDIGILTVADIEKLEAFIKSVKPLDDIVNISLHFFLKDV